MTKDAPRPTWHDGNMKLELGLSDLAPDHEGFDPRASLRAMVPEGGWQDGRNTPYHDGTTPTFLVEHLRRAGDTVTAANAQAAHITAGHARDCHQIFSSMLSTTTTNLMKNLGAKPGSLSTPHSDKEPLGKCDCCNETTSAMWKVPPSNHTDNFISDAISAIQANRARNICRREMALFPSPAPTPTTHAKAGVYLRTHRSAAALRQLAADRGIHLDRAQRQTKQRAAMALATQDEEDDGTAQRGPAKVRARIKALVESTKMKACMSCTLPLQAASARQQAGHSSDNTTWNTVRRLAQGKSTHSKMKAIPPEERLEPPKDILERGDLNRHTGRDAIWYDDAGHEHTGTIALIAKDTEEGDLEAFATTTEEDQQTQEPWTKLTIEELQRAIDTKASRDERHYTMLFERERAKRTSIPRERRIGAGEVAAAAAAAADTTTEDATIKAFADAGYTMQELGDDANAPPVPLRNGPTSITHSNSTLRRPARKHLQQAHTNDERKGPDNRTSRSLEHMATKHYQAQPPLRRPRDGHPGGDGNLWGLGRMEHEPKKANSTNVLLTWRRENCATRRRK